MKAIKINGILLVVGIGLALFLYKKYRVPPKIAFQELSLTHLDNTSVSLQDYAGKNIFITMWAPWCRDCLAEMPDLQFVKEQLKAEDFVFLAISGYNIEQEKAFAQKMPYDFVYLHMQENLKEIDVHAIPTNYIINKRGALVYQKVGAEPNWRSKETLAKIKNLVKD